RVQDRGKPRPAFAPPSRQAAGFFGARRRNRHVGAGADTGRLLPPEFRPAHRDPTNRAVALARPAEEISMLDVVHAIDGGGLWSHCLLGLAQCSDETPCPAHAVWKKARGMLEYHLRSNSIADLSRVILDKRRRRPRPPSRSASLRRSFAKTRRIKPGK